MKLILCSEGFHTQNTIDKCYEFVEKPKEDISVSIINEAFAVETGDKRWVVDNLNSVFNNFRYKVDIVNLLALDIGEVERRLNETDVIFVVGGHTDYLMSVFNKTGFDKLLPKLLQTKVYVGSSAGSQILGKRINDEAYKMIYGEDADWHVDKWMNIVDLSIMAHLDSPDFPNRKETLLEATSAFEGKVYGLRDDSAVVVENNNIYTIGSNPVIIEDGKLVSS